MGKLLLCCLLVAGLVSGVARASTTNRSLTVDRERSHIEVSVKSTLDSFVAKLAAYDVAVHLDATEPRVLTAVVRFKFDDVKTGKADRDKQMNEWQHTAQFPDAGFSLTSLTPTSVGHATATGKMQLHGIEREMTFPVAITADPNLFSVDGEAKLDTRDFGLPIIRKFGMLKVDPVVTVRFHLQGTVAAP